MGKILMRAAMSPINENKTIDVVSKNLIGSNMGNMIFAASVARTVMTEDTQVDTILTNRIFSDEEIAQMNATYECFLIPLANAFRTSFVGELQCLTSLIKALKIPCIVVGVGVQAKFDKQLDNGFSFDEDVKQFLEAVLEKSTKVGVRGEITGDYLKSLGFMEERDYTVIGCPSMYLHGKDLPTPHSKELSKESKVSINFKLELPDNMHELFKRSMQMIPDFYFIPQSIEELRLMYAGVPYPAKKRKRVPEHYPLSIASDIYCKDRVRGFVNVESWLSFLQSVDFSFGSRIHGNIAAVLAGTPSFIFAPDVRVQELATYHNIPFMPASEITEKTSILDIYQKTDFTKVLDGHEARFFHFLDFLNQNEIRHIYNADGVAKKVPFDEIRKEAMIEPPVCSISSVSVEEQAERLELYHLYQERKYIGLKKEKITTKEEILSEEKPETWKDKFLSKFGL